MQRGTLVVSRAAKLFPYYKKQLGDWGFRDVEATGEEKDSLLRVITELKPRLVLVESGFYHAGTPYMLGRILEKLPGLNMAAVSLGEFPDSLAAWFIWHGVKSYINLWEGWEEFYRGMREVRMGNEYIAPRVQRLIDDFSEWPETFTHVTKRQMEVLIMICNGFTPERIGAALHLSRRTVNWHLLDLYRVFHARNREELVRAAFTLELVSRRDLLFYDRDKQTAPLPEWAAAKQRADRRAGEWL